MKIGFLTRGLETRGSSRVRVHQYLKYLHELGIETSVLPYVPKPGALSRAKYVSKALKSACWADIVFLQKPNQSKMLLDALRRLNRRLIVDIDDAVWSAHSGKKRKPGGHGSRKFGDRLKYAIRCASFVVTGSRYLADAVLRFSPDASVTVIPPSVDLNVYQRLKKVESKKDVVIGWIGTPGNFRDLVPILPALHAITKKPNVKIQIVSSEPPHLDGLPIEFVNWSAVTEVETLLQFDIGIMPLHDEERARGRCGYKSIQCMGVGIPVVASPIGAGVEVVEHESTGFHAKTIREWEDRLTLLIQNPELRREMGVRGREKVEKFYSVQKNLHALVDVFYRRMSS